MRQSRYSACHVRANCLLALVLALAASRAPAALISYEPFDYPLDKPLVGATNGFGFDEPWRPGGFNARLFNLARMKPGALAFPGLATKGTNHLQIDAVPDGIGEIQASRGSSPQTWLCPGQNSTSVSCTGPMARLNTPPSSSAPAMAANFPSASPVR